jgi:hypothetical protein
MLSHSPRIVTDGLIYCLDAANPKSLMSASPIQDVIAGDSLTSAIPPNYIDNKYLDFDGTACLPYVGTEVLQASTVEVWFYLKNRNNATIAAAGSNTYNSSVWQWSVFNYGQQTWAIGRAQGATAGNITPYVPLNKWVQVIMLRDDIKTLVYVDGVLVNTHGQQTTVTGSVIIGGTGTQEMGGYFGALKLYNRALSPEEILQNYNATKSRFGL